MLIYHRNPSDRFLSHGGNRARTVDGCDNEVLGLLTASYTTIECAGSAFFLIASGEAKTKNWLSLKNSGRANTKFHEFP